MRTARQEVSEDQRRKLIADSAYFRAERRGFNGGDPLHDWLEAETEVDARLHKKGGKDLLAELDERLAVANGRLRAFKKKLSGMKADVREKWTHDVEELAKLRDRFQKRLEEIRTQGEHASEKTKAQADKIWHEISDVIERVSSRRSGRAK
jgi:DNA anti-recombination protein RmuC